MAVSLGFGLLMLDQGPVRVHDEGLLLNESAPLCAMSTGNKSRLGYQSIIKVDLCCLALTHLLSSWFWPSGILVQWFTLGSHSGTPKWPLYLHVVVRVVNLVVRGHGAVPP